MKFQRGLRGSCLSFLGGVATITGLLSGECGWAITFDLRDLGATAEIESGVITRNGVKATLTPYVAGGSGVLNQTSSGFGINATGSSDDADGLDGGIGVESIALSFDADVLFTGINLSLFGSGESASLTIAGFASNSLTDTGSGTDVFAFATDNLVTVGQMVLLRYVSGNGFSFDSFSVDLRPARTPVPDTMSAGVSLGAVMVLFLVCRLVRRSEESMAPSQQSDL